VSRLGRKTWGSLGCGVLLALIQSACGTAPPPSVELKRDPVPNDSAVVQTLKKQLRERDKRIEELESQLEALKIIDQDFEMRRKPVRPPATLTPIEGR
jgi:TolA-binding protein